MEKKMMLITKELTLDEHDLIFDKYMELS